MRTKFDEKSKISGFSLIELMLALTMVIAILGILSSIMVGMNFQLRNQKVRMESVSNAQAAADTLVRSIRMAGNRPSSCITSFVVTPLSVSNPVSGGYFGTLRIQSDWNQPNCNLSGVDEDVTFSVADNVLYIDANKTVAFVDKIAAVRFMLFDENNVVITNSSLAEGAKFIRIELDTISSDGTVRTLTSGASLRK